MPPTRSTGTGSTTRLRGTCSRIRVATWSSTAAMRSQVIMRPDQALLPELERVGVPPESIRWVVQSHLHLDHTGALAVIDRLPNAEVLVTRTEFETAHNLQSWERAAYCPADYDKPGVPWSLLEDAEDGYDLFG